MDSIDREPVNNDNPRHAVWIEDERGLRRITSSEPGAEDVTVGGRRYAHTREIGSGQWVYTVVEVVL